MSMQPESLEVLEGANLPSSQARAIVRAIEIEIAGARDVLATKHDIVLLRADMTALRADLRSELKSEISGLRGDLESRSSDLRGELRAEIHGSASSITRQMYTAMLGQMAVLLGLAYFFVTRLQ